MLIVYCTVSTLLILGFQLNSEELVVSSPRAPNLRSEPQRASRRTFQCEGIVINHVDNLSPSEYVPYILQVSNFRLRLV